MSEIPYEFTQVSTNVIGSSSGRTIQLLGRAGLRVTLDGDVVDVNSEMLASPMSIAIYSNSIPTEVSARVPDLLDEVVAGLKWAGFTVQLV